MEKQALEKNNFEKLKTELAKRIIEKQRIHENSKYGEFIIQTNEIQYYLMLLIFIRSFIPDKNLRKYLEEAQFSNLIGCFRIIAKNIFELRLINSLELYKKSRNALAHKMFTNKKLTFKECNLSLGLGTTIKNALYELLMKEVK